MYSITFMIAQMRTQQFHKFHCMICFVIWYSTVDRNRSAGAGGDEIITEYATTRRLDVSFGGMTQDEAEKYYTKEYQLVNIKILTYEKRDLRIVRLLILQMRMCSYPVGPDLLLCVWSFL